MFFWQKSHYKAQQSLTFLPSDRSVPAKESATVLDRALANRIPISHSCGGMGSCTTCLVRVCKGAEKLPPRTAPESERAQERGFEKHERLACQIPAQPGLVVEVQNPKKTR